MIKTRLSRDDQRRQPPLSSFPLISRLRLRTAMMWGQFKRSWSIFRGNNLAIIGLILIVIFGIMAISHPILLKTVWPSGTYDPVTGFDMTVFPHPAPPSTKHLLGTDPLGRDVLSMVLAATTPTFVLGLTAALCTAIVGTTIGMISGFYGGAVDAILSRISDVFLLFPAPILMVIIGSRFREIGPAPLGLIYGIVAGAGTTSVIMRSHAMKIRVMPFIEASRIAGGRSGHAIFKHVLPHMLPLAGLQMMIAVTGAVVADGFISFLGMTRNIHNWGTIIYNAFTYNQYLSLTQSQWNVLIPPSMCLSLFALAFYLVSRGMEDVADPRIAERRARAHRRRPLKLLKLKFLKPSPADQIPPHVLTPRETSGRLQPGEIAKATLLLAKLHAVPLSSMGASSDELLGRSDNLMRDAIPIISQHCGLVSQIDSTSLVAIFGISPQRLPSPVSALLATHAGLALSDYITAQNKSRSLHGLPDLNLSIGIATGDVTAQDKLRSNYGPSPFFGNVLKTAQRLQKFTIATKSGGVLISEETYRNLSGTRTHFIFGRQGTADFPWEKKQKMVYEVGGRTVQLVENAPGHGIFRRRKSGFEKTTPRIGYA
jgi:peptide/nickel transport system permease protein